MTKDYNKITKPVQRKLRLKKLHVEPSKFQPRSIELDHGHVADLVRVLATGKALDPLHVRSVGDGSFTVLDGHHSFAAYREAKWRGAVPALVYSCTVAEGQQIAARENSKARLQMKDEEKRDWAWRLTVEQAELSRTQVSQLCNVSPATVSRMRRVLKRLNDNEIDTPKSWKAAQIAVEGKAQGEWSEEQQEEWRQAAYAKLKQNIARDIVQYSEHDPELVLEVVQEIMGNSRFATGAEHLGFHEGEINDFTGEFTPANQPDDGDDEF
ncbi:ParB/RepB/Spo0J family partition protein [Yoonia sp. R78084]|uniref:ParB/RepB/Spo0J family partition protein n=1 Tax=Yoonia sp. R78084 TaxID=3093869 RepID=UPI0037DDAB55